jgi:hypothetical protein
VSPNNPSVTENSRPASVVADENWAKSPGRGGTGMQDCSDIETSTTSESASVDRKSWAQNDTVLFTFTLVRRALRGHFCAHPSPSSHYRSNSPSVMFTRAGYAPFASAVTRLPSLLASVGPARRTLSSPSINALFNPTDEHLAMRATLRTFVEREVRN